MNVAILIYPDCLLSTAFGMLDILTHAKQVYQAWHAQSAEQLTGSVGLVAVGPSQEVAVQGALIHCGSVLDTCSPADLILIPPMTGRTETVVAKHTTLIAWLRAQHDLGATLCSSCTGVFLLAATGLLDGREATTSWFSANDFRVMFPKVQLRADRVLVDSSTLITGGSTLAFANLCVYIIEKQYGKRVANQCANVFLVDKSKQSQQPYYRFVASRTHQDTQIEKVQAYIEAHANDKLTVQQVATACALSERSFVRRFKAATGRTPSEYIQLVKVEQAKLMLEEGGQSIKEIAFGIGYDDLAYFRSLFKRHTGLNPVDYRRQFTS